MASSDFIVYGLAEASLDGGVTNDAVRTALLPKNTRRCLVSPIRLFSNNRKEAAYTTLGLSSPPSVKSFATSSNLDNIPANACTDFVLFGCAPESEAGGISLAEATTALLSSPVLDTRCAVELTSCNSRCEHFVTNGVCSALLTNKDVLWMESVTECAPGVLFRRFREATSEPASACELPYDPMRRFHALSAAGALRTPRGAKNVEHCENLRRSDPLINLGAWHDWAALYEGIKTSRAAHIHQKAVIDRALLSHQRRTAANATAVQRSLAERYAADTRARWAERRRGELAPWALPVPTGSPTGALKRSLHSGRLKAVDTHASRGERASADSVMALLDGGLDVRLELDAAEQRAPKHAKNAPRIERRPSTEKSVATPPMEISMEVLTDTLDKEREPEREPSAERSPTSVVHLAHRPADFDAQFPPLPASKWDASKWEDETPVTKAVDHALHEYKLVSGPGWYSDS